MSLRESSAELDAAARDVVDAAILVHRKLGPGLLESHYREALVDELRSRGRLVDIEVPVRGKIDDRKLSNRFYLDMRVDGVLVVETKAVKKLLPIHLQQTSSYLAATGHQLALVLNFAGPRMKEGIRRIIRTT